MIDFDKITVGIISLTIGHWDLMENHIRSVYETYPHPKEIYIISNCQFEKSLSGAINRGFKNAMSDNVDYIVYAADDTIVGENAIQDLIICLDENPELWIVHGTALNSSGWDMFAARKELFEVVGFWDEGFYPAYFEDNDFARRISLIDPEGLKYKYIPINFEHIGSQTMNRMNEIQISYHHSNFDRVKQRYIQKWGGEPGKETYTVPWDMDYSKMPGF